jgi:hypothetical protein
VEEEAFPSLCNIILLDFLQITNIPGMPWEIILINMVHNLRMRIAIKGNGVLISRKASIR